MTDAISALREERAAILARLDRIDAAIAEYERWADSVLDLLGDANTTPSAPDHDVTARGRNDEGEQLKSSPIAEFEDAVRLILGEADKPYPRGPLLSSLERLGIVIISSNPANAMATRLSRMDDVINVKGEGYWLTNKLTDEGISNGDNNRDDEESLI